MNENECSYIIRGAVFRIYNDLGPGLYESVYESALTYELTKADLFVQNQVALPAIYKTTILNTGFRIDLLVNRLVIVEIKSVEKLLEVHHKQLITYLKLSGIKLGLLINFNTNDISQSIFRKVNGL